MLRYFVVVGGSFPWLNTWFVFYAKTSDLYKSEKRNFYVSIRDLTSLILISSFYLSDCKGFDASFSEDPNNRLYLQLVNSRPYSLDFSANITDESFG